MAKSGINDPRVYRQEFELAEDMVAHEGVYVVDESGAKIRGVRAQPLVVPEEIGDRSYLSMDRVLDTPTTRGTAVLLYRDDDGSNDLRIVAISIDSNGVTTEGTSVQVTSYTSSYGEVAKIAGGKFVAVYLNSSGYAEAVIGTVSGTTISLGTPLALSSTGTDSYIDVTGLAENEFVAVYRSTFGPSGLACYCTVATTTITLSDKSTFYSGAATRCKVAKLSDTKFAVFYNLSSTPWQRAANIVLGAASYGTASQIYRGSQYIKDVCTIDANDYAIVASTSTFNIGSVVLIQWTGTTANVGNQSTFSAATANEVDLDQYEDKPGYFNIFYERNTFGYYRKSCRASYPNILLGTEKELTKSDIAWPEVVGLEDEELFLAWHVPADSETWTYLISNEYELTIERVVGVLESAGSTGQTRWVTLLGGVYDQKTGMIPGEYWYLDAITGLLTTSNPTWPIGIAIDDDKLKLLFPDQEYGP